MIWYSAPRLSVWRLSHSFARKLLSEASKKVRNFPFFGSTFLSDSLSSKWAKNACVKSSASCRSAPRRRMNPWIGCQYLRHNLSSAAAERVESAPPAVRTTLQFVVVKAPVLSEIPADGFPSGEL